MEMGLVMLAVKTVMGTVSEQFFVICIIDMLQMFRFIFLSNLFVNNRK